MKTINRFLIASLVLANLSTPALHAMKAPEPNTTTTVNKTKIVVIKGDITNQPTQAIVNAANTQLQHGSGIAGAIAKTAGHKLQPFCDKLPKQFHGHRLPVGGALCTPSFDLKKYGIAHIIHTAGPDCRDYEQNKNRKKLLASSYQSSLRCAHDNGVTTIAFPSISTGIFGFDIKEASHIAMKTVIAYVQEHAHFTEIRFIGFDDKACALYAHELDTLLGTKEPKNKAPRAKSTQQKSLTEFNYASASVLPITYFERNGQQVKYAILARESGGKDAGTYDDFGGSRDHGELHPAITAAREFFEEAICANTLGMSLNDVRHYIDIKTGNTELILAQGHRCMFLTHFIAKDMIRFKNNFHHARAKARGKFREKDRIATVHWDLLKDAIKKSQSDKGVTVQARLVDPATGHDEGHKTTITLRPLLVKKLRPLFENKDFNMGKSSKIRFY